MGGCLVLTIIGGVAEIVGFGLAFYEMAVTQRREFPDYRPLHHRALAWIRRHLPGAKKSKTAHVHASDALATSDAALAFTVKRGPATTMEERIKRLEAEMQDLQRQQREDHAALEAGVVEAHQRITETDTSVRSELNRMEAERKANLRESIAFDKTGIWLFVGGVILSVLGNAINC